MVLVIQESTHDSELCEIRCLATPLCVLTRHCFPSSVLDLDTLSRTSGAIAPLTFACATRTVSLRSAFCTPHFRGRSTQRLSDEVSAKGRVRRARACRKSICNYAQEVDVGIKPHTWRIKVRRSISE